MLSGSTLEAMAQAVEQSSFVILFISRAYKESGNCRLEAEYAFGYRQGGSLQLLFVMCEPDYTCTSKPDRVSGWLGIMVGQTLWYPGWDVPGAIKVNIHTSHFFVNTTFLCHILTFDKTW